LVATSLCQSAGRYPPPHGIYYADKAYDSRALRAKLAEMGIEDRIAYKAKRNKPLVN
jgi:IS5 family transposase